MEKHSLEFLYTALKSAEEHVRSFDTKAQIVGVGYIFTAGLIHTIGSTLPQRDDYISSILAIILSWGLVIGPIILFGAVLYPTRNTAPKVGEEHSKVLKLFFTDSEHSESTGHYLKALESSDLRVELTYELLKVSGLRNLKRNRFLRALWAALICLIMLFGLQLYRAVIA
ncbi:hypothetical protein ACMXYV_07135 [Neptuniibacter sp. SY11_33]|uniref:hypothetical protein n=1 Tax=Neptuniibacter sp. SY11_33 TaxID=3398215 RepID=UPI0039F47617